VHLNLQGNCHGCPSSAATLKNSIEQAIFDLAPDVAGIQVDAEETPKAAHPGNNGFVPVEQLSIGKSKLNSNLKSKVFTKGNAHENA